MKAVKKSVTPNVRALPIPKGGPWTLERSQEFCLDMARREPQNSQLAYWFLGNALRPHVATLYAYQRTLLNLTESPEHEALFAAWEVALYEAFRGNAEHPVFVSVRAMAEEFNMPVTPFKDLIVGAQMSVQHKRFTSYQALQTYVDKIGVPLGRLVLALAGDTDIDHIRAADDISTAMTLNTFWSYVDADFQKGRLHIPQEDMLRFGVTESDLTQRRTTPAFRALMEFQISRTRMFLMRGRPLCSHLPDALQRELQMIWFGVNVVLDNILANGCDVFSRNYPLTPRDWVRASLRLGRWRLKELTQW